MYGSLLLFASCDTTAARFFTLICLDDRQESCFVRPIPLEALGGRKGRKIDSPISRKVDRSYPCPLRQLVGQLQIFQGRVWSTR